MLDRALHQRWLLELTQIPTASGREFRVVRWIERWARERPEITLTKDSSGNLHLALKNAPTARRPVYFTAHLDHPAFVVERLVAPGMLLLSFRGGVNAAYFHNARVRIHSALDLPFEGTLRAKEASTIFDHYLCELDAPNSPGADSLAVGDVGVWALPPARIERGLVYTPACDDLAAAAAALAAFDTLRHAPGEDVRLLFTLAEEIGFVGALGACRPGRPATMPLDARVLALENSRSFPDSPIGGGPIVRVGDRLSIFTPALTASVAKRAEELAAQEKKADRVWPWQRKLMAGGACEASVFCHAGYDATCVCLPLGNYHNMGQLAELEAKALDSPAIAPEFIALADFEGLVDLLIACGTHLPESARLPDRFEKLWNERSFVLNNP